MSVFDRIDFLTAQLAGNKLMAYAKPEEKQAPMPKLSFDEIDAAQQDEQKLNAPARKKPGPKPKVK